MCDYRGDDCRRYAYKKMDLVRSAILAAIAFSAALPASCTDAPAGKTVSSEVPGKTGLWPGDARGAISLTYDDGMPTQFETVLGALRRYNLKATFYISAGTGETPNRHVELAEAAGFGHELGNHTIFHPCLGSDIPGESDWVTPARDLRNYTVDRLVDELTVANRLISAIDGKSRRTFAYTCGNREVGRGIDFVSVLPDLFPAARTVTNGTFTRAQLAAQPHLIPSFAVNGHGGAELIAYAESIIAAGGYGTITFHGVGGDWLSVSKEAHEDLLAYLSANRDKIWVDTVLAVSDYARDAEQED